MKEVSLYKMMFPHLVEGVEGCLNGLLKFVEKPSKRAWWADYFSLNKRIAETEGVTWYRGIRET
jgi:hypothetical protein